MSANYPEILAKVIGGKWAITEATFQGYESFLTSRLAGDKSKLEADDIDEEVSDDPEIKGTTIRIPIYGIIGQHLSRVEVDYFHGCDLDRINNILDIAEDDPSLDTVLLDFRSPGGTISGLPETADKIRALAENKDVIAFSDSYCCSAALWLAAMAPKFYCTRSAQVGSVGVYLALLDKSRMLEDMGIKVNAIVSGKYKLAGSSFKRLTPEEEAMFQAEVDKIASEFRSAVQLNRSVQSEFLEGQTYMGQDAVDAGFCDSLVEDREQALRMRR